jgi:hypothetical protein
MRGSFWCKFTINQVPVVAMIENHRSGLLWQLVMGAPEVRLGLARLGFTSPHLQAQQRC